MSTSFHVRKLDPSTALRPSDPGSLPEIQDVETVLSNAFSHDLFTAVLNARNPKSADTSYVGPFWVTTVVAGLLGGEVWVAETRDEPKKIVGCAVWFGPGHTMYDSEEQQKHVLGPLMAGFSPELQKWWSTKFLPQFDAFVGSALGGETVKHNSWHLQTLAVDPAYHRRGVARLLIDEIAAKAASTNTPLCVETNTHVNVEIYTKLGFKLMPRGKDDVDACKEDFVGVDGNTFPMWVLARSPSTA